MAKEGKDMEKKLVSRNGSIAPEAKGKDYNGKGNSNRNQRFHGKRREPWSAEANPQPKYQPPAPKPRNKSFEKRVRGKQNWSGRRDEVTKAQRAEFGSALPQGSKKINLNHLLNFKLEPRGQQQEGKTPYRGQWSTRNKWGSYKQHTRYNKEQFLQANCQFVVKSSEDYQVHMVDADAIVDWDVVEQVRLLGHEVPSCPICLYPPSAAQITRCGHIFCWSCILHYLALSDKTWRKCPICYESVIKKDLKSVVAAEQHLFKPGDEITMCLMKRQRGSVISQPVYLGEDLQDVTKPYNILEKKSKSCYVKLLTASPEEVKHLILSSERASLEKQMQENDDELEGTFIQSALDSLKDREQALTGGVPSMIPEVKDPPAEASKSASSVSDEEEDVKVSTASNDEDYVVYASAFSDEEEEAPRDDAAGVDNSASADGDDDNPVFQETGTGEPSDSRFSKSTGDLVVASADEVSDVRRPTTSESTDGEFDGLSPPAAVVQKGWQSQKTHTYYFYQSDDGQPIFIHPLNVRCLVQQYGSLDKCPLTITAKIVEMDYMSMTEDIRHRLRYMVHLPLTSNFSVCELDLKPPVLSEETLLLFQDDFLKRKKARDRKLKEEKRRERRLQAEAGKIYGNYPRARYSLKSNRHFPSVGPSSSVSDDQPALSSGSSTASPGPATPLSASVEEDLIFPSAPDTAAMQPHLHQTVDVTPQAPAVPSFAQMLREGQARPSPPKKVVVSQPTAQTQPGKTKDGAGSEESDNEDYIPVPQYQDAFSDAIQDALDKVTLNSSPASKGEVSSGSSSGRKGKKGRKKQQLLFSTAGPRFK